jgi:hypothetical protein
MAVAYTAAEITAPVTRPRTRWFLSLILCLLGTVRPGFTQDQPPPAVAREDTRTQYPALLVNSYFSVNIGRIDYGFSREQLEPGFSAESIHNPRIAVRAVLIGHQFAPWLSVQAHYLRPVEYMGYRNISGAGTSGRVWMHFGGVTGKTQVPLGRRLSIYGEAGMGLTSRRGFESGLTPVVRDAHFGNGLFGGGLEYQVNRKWDLLAGTLVSTGSSEHNQPRTTFTSGGFRYTMRELPADVVDANRTDGYVFPEHLVQVSYTTDALGYGFNTLVSKKVPIFWGGNVHISRGMAVHYEQNVFHTRKVFGFDVGASAGSWKSRDNGEWFQTLSVYPLFRFTLLRTRPADMYVAYSLAGPTYMSKSIVDGLPTGNAFTFQDFMGMGFFLGPERRFNVGVKINHYSNGNIFTENAGVKIPYTFNVGYTF